jgi:hypothetical protein
MELTLTKAELKDAQKLIEEFISILGVSLPF